MMFGSLPDTVEKKKMKIRYKLEISQGDVVIVCNAYAGGKVFFSSKIVFISCDRSICISGGGSTMYVTWMELLEPRSSGSYSTFPSTKLYEFFAPSSCTNVHFTRYCNHCNDNWYKVPGTCSIFFVVSL